MIEKAENDSADEMDPRAILLGSIILPAEI